VNVDSHDLDSPSEWVIRWADQVPVGGRVLDIACGSGRHARFFAARGYPVDAADRDPAKLAGLFGIPGITIRCADLEGGPWPYEGQRFAGIIVANYLHRPLLPRLVESIAPKGVLVYETFAMGNERFGRPSNPDFLLRPGELLEAVRGRLRVIAYEEHETADPRPAQIQRLCAINSSPGVSI